MNVQAHDSEILCLEFSKPDTGEDPLSFTSTAAGRFKRSTSLPVASAQESEFNPVTL